jgi:hypothetical protein
MQRQAYIYWANAIIFQGELDSGNFRKKILSLGILRRTPVKDQTDSKKGAFIYKYVEDNQEQVKLTQIFKLKK